MGNCYVHSRHIHSLRARSAVPAPRTWKASTKYSLSKYIISIDNNIFIVHLLGIFIICIKSPLDGNKPRPTRFHDSSQAGTRMLVPPHALWASGTSTAHQLSPTALALPPEASGENELPSSWILFWFKRRLRKYLYSTFIAAYYNNQEVGASQVSIDSWMNAQAKCSMYT